MPAFIPTRLGASLLLIFCLIDIGCRKSPAPDANTMPATRDVTSVVVDPASSGEEASTAIGYVGSQSCQDCHSEIAATYAQHSMGKSAAPLVGDAPFPAAKSAQFEADGFRYEMIRQGPDWVHHQGRVVASGECAEIDLRVSHVIGSGKNGQSFLVNRDGYLFMSPMTWYPAKGVWDLSPGYETNNSQFNRPVIEECLYCHTDGANAVHTTINQYKDPLLRAHVIGCERCHGPGQLHVTAMQEGDGAQIGGDTKIINPAHLTPELREAVCQQCHLSGAVRVLKPNKTLNDFQPGKPLNSAYTIFTLAHDGKNFVGHVEQMYQSKCFQRSDGQLGCISCHDPHALPSVDAKVQYYRDRCLTCHAVDACSLESPKRLSLSADDNCVMCHMPRRPTEIRHAAVTDHSVPRRVTPTSEPASDATQQLVAFPDDSIATPRDKSIALVRVAMRHPELLGEATFGVVLSTLEKIVKQNPDDFSAADALAELFLIDQRVDDALRICHQVLALEPRREATLLIVCETYSRLGRYQEAASYWEQMLEVNPWMSKYWYSLGGAYAALQRWSRCKQLAIEGKKRFPTSIGLRHLLVECHLQLGDRSAAEAEFQEIAEFQPAKLDSLRQWYESHPARANAGP